MNSGQSAEAIAIALNGKRQGAGWIASCPAHEDKVPSLSVNQSNNGKVLVKCHAGCPQIAVIDSLKQKGLWTAKVSPRLARKETRYEYTNRESQPVLQIRRFDYGDGSKDIRQFKNEKGRWEPGKPKCEIAPYRYMDWQHNKKIIVLVEGEKCADAVFRVGLNSTTTPGGASAWSSDFATYFRNRDVVIIPDNDPAGRAYAHRAINDLHSIANSIRYLELPELNINEDVFDWIEKGHTKEQLQTLIDESPVVDDESIEILTENDWPLLIPLRNQTSIGIDSSVLPEPIGSFVQAVADHTETPPELSIVMTLGAVSLAAARRFTLQVKEGYIETLNLYVLAALESGNRKSPVYNLCHKPLYEWEAQMAKEMAPKIRENEIEIKNVEAELKKLRNRLGNKGETGDSRAKIIGAIKALEFSTPKKITPPRLLASDITPEALAYLLEQNNEVAGVFSDEGGIFELLGGRYSSGIANIDLALKAYSGSAHTVDRRSAPAIHLKNPLLVFCISPQPSVLRGLIQDPVFRGRGLVARFLYLMPESPLGQRTGQTNILGENVVLPYHKLVSEILNLSSSLTLRFSPDAYAVWHEYWRQVENEMREDGNLANLKDWAAKFPGNLARIAGLMHLSKLGGKFNEIEDHLVVGTESVIRATALGDLLKAHAIKTFQALSLDPAHHMACLIADWISKEKMSTFSRRSCHKRFQKRIQSSKELAQPLRLLEERGYVRPLTRVMGPAGGRPSEFWEVNPRFIGKSRPG